MKHGLEFYWKALSQAEGFAEVENWIEAKARAKALVEALEAELENYSGDQKSVLEDILFTAKKRYGTYRELFDKHNQKVADRRQSYTDNYAQEMQEPLPMPADVF